MNICTEKHDRSVAVEMLKPRVDDYGLQKAVDCKDTEFESCTKEDAGDGWMSIDYRVPVCRMLIGYRVPGLLKIKIMTEQEVRQHTRKPVG